MPQSLWLGSSYILYLQMMFPISITIFYLKYSYPLLLHLNSLLPSLFYLPFAVFILFFLSYMYPGVASYKEVPLGTCTLYFCWCLPLVSMLVPSFSFNTYLYIFVFPFSVSLLHPPPPATYCLSLSLSLITHPFSNSLHTFPILFILQYLPLFAHTHFFFIATTPSPIFRHILESSDTCPPLTTPVISTPI